jgi:hypothetical protein|tara:strand:- start:2983 stop:3285 length:303 start_codon:yes stop_codon:yes gene_type:complete
LTCRQRVKHLCDVTDIKKPQSNIKIRIFSTGESCASSVFLSSVAGLTFPSGSRKKEGGFEFHCAINKPLENGKDNEAGAASKDVVRGSKFQLAPMVDLSN